MFAMCGLALLVWGCVNYARWKGLSGWFGAFGYLFLFGLIVLVFFPNRREQHRKCATTEPDPEQEQLELADRVSGLCYLPLSLSLPPLLLGAALIGRLSLLAAGEIPASAWQTYRPADASFAVDFPGRPTPDISTVQTPNGPDENDNTFASGTAPRNCSR